MAAECTLPDDRPLDGTDLLSAVANQEQFDAQRDLFWRTDYNYAMVSGRWKYILNTRYNHEFLFNLSEDPGEQHNLATKLPEMTNAFREKIMEWSSQMKKPRWPGVMEYIYDLEGDSTFWAI